MKKWNVFLFAALIVGCIFWSCSDDSSTESPNEKPTLTIKSPVNNSMFTEGDNIIINVEANDEDGSIGEVRFYIDNNAVGTDSEFPYSCTYANPILSVGEHRIRIVAKDNDGGEKTDSVNIGVSLKAPSALNVLQNTVSSFTLNWIDNSSDEEGYKIERKIDDTAFTEIATVGVNVRTFTDNTVLKKGYGTVYYQIRAYKGTTYYSTYATANSAVLFPAPTNLTVVQSSITSANTTWSDNSIGEDMFEIERKLAAETDYVKLADVTGSDTANKSWVDNTVVPNLTYDYRVRAVKGTNNTAYISKTLINTFPAPTNLTATQNNVYTFTLNWTDNSTGEDGFKIERKIDDGAYTLLATVTGSSYVDNTVLKKGYGTVYYQIRAYKGTTYYSTYATANSAVLFPAPTNLTVVQASITSANITWSDNSIGEDMFEIERKLAAETDYVKLADVTGSDTANKSWVDNTVVPNLTYDYRLRAVKGTNNTAYISKTLINTFPAPTNLTATQINITSANLSWTDNSIGEDKFEIERKLSTETTYIKLTDVIGSDTASKSWVDNTVVPNLTYDYRLRAVKGTNSTTYIIKTLDNAFQAPTELIAVVASDTSIKLNWTDNSSYEEGFKIDRKIGTDGTWESDYATVGANVRTYTNTSLTTGTYYYYRVRAYYSTYYSSYTNEANATPISTGFVSIPTGSFSMGQTDVATPVHTVYITRPFYIGKYEVTQKEWQTIMGSNPSNGYGVGDYYPVYYVNWYAILVYCNKRSIAEGLTPCYTINGSTDPEVWGTVPTSSITTWREVTCNFSAKGYRLPTEAEWEYSAQYNDERTYPWGETTPDSSLCNFYNNVGAAIIGSYPSGNNNLGLCDMAGNVWEWVWDWYDTYPSISQIDPTGPTTIELNRVLRGGGFNYGHDLMRCAKRMSEYPHNNISGHGPGGFRLAMTK